MCGEYLPAMNSGIARMIFWLAVVTCVVGQGALIRSVLAAADPRRYPDDRRKRSRRGGMRWGPDRRAPSPENTRESSVDREIVWAVLPALSLAALLTATWFALPD